MTTVRPTEAYPAIIAFDGTVLEVFRMSSSERMHISLIEKLEVKTDKKGTHRLDINAAGGYTMQGLLVDDQALPRINALIAEVEKAKAQFKFD
jgi:hypothetical protein